MDHIKQLHSSLGLIALQMTNQMPSNLDCGLRIGNCGLGSFFIPQSEIRNPKLPITQNGLFLSGFLHAILSEIGDPQGHGLPNDVRGNPLRHADQRHGGRIAVAALTGTPDTLPHQRQTMVQRVGGEHGGYFSTTRKEASTNAGASDAP